MKISIIVAVAADGAIGKNNDLLCHIPGDLKRFKSLTVGHTVIMGRKTLESLPNGNPLTDRRNIVLTSNPNQLPEGCEGATSMQEALQKVKNEDEVFIIGGGKVYQEAYPLADFLYLTQIHAEFPEADTFFPKIDKIEWEEICREDHEKTEKCPYQFSFVNLRRK